MVVPLITEEKKKAAFLSVQIRTENTAEEEEEENDDI